MTKSTKICCICSQIAGQEAGDLISQLLGEETYERRIALESKSFAVIPSLGPIVPGYTLLCPKAHIRSYANLVPLAEHRCPSQATSDLLNELNCITVQLTTALQSLYAAPVHRFEHGSGTANSRIICTVDHAHLHFLPTQVNILPLLLADSMWEPAKPDVLYLARRVSDREYLYYESPDGVALIAARKHAYESQHMRRIFARALGSATDWNWRTNPRPDVADNLYRSLAQFVSQ